MEREREEGMERVRVGEEGMGGKKREGERGDERKKGGERIESCGRDNKDGEVVKVTTMNRKSCGIDITIMS